jgi:hypothetical protein
MGQPTIELRKVTTKFSADRKLFHIHDGTNSDLAKASLRASQNLLVILERDVGFFSLFIQVVNTLRLLEEGNLGYIPIALFGSGCIYFHENGHMGKRSVWEYYFEPLVPGKGEEVVLDALGSDPFGKIESIRRAKERERGLVEFPQDINLLPPLTKKDKRNLAQVQSTDTFAQCVWTENFLPVIDGKHLSPSYDLAEGRLVIERYIRFRPYIADAIEVFFVQYLAAYYVIGVHVRGTDGHSAPARGVEIPFCKYFVEIEREIETAGRENCRVFLATDEQNFINLFVERFGDVVVFYDALRKTDNDEIFGVGPTGQVLPAYITKSQDIAVRNGADVVIEYGLLCKAHMLIHNKSSISHAVKYNVERYIQVS